VLGAVVIMYQHAFVITADDRYFPGLWALLNSINAYHGGELRTFVVSVGFSADSFDALKTHPLGSSLTLIDSRDFPYPPGGAWEAKQCVLSYLAGSVVTACLLDADLVLLSRLDDVFAFGDKGRIVTSQDGQEPFGFDERCAVYSPSLVGTRFPYFNSGFLCLNLRKHWDLVALWEFTSRFAGYSSGGGKPFGFPGHGDQGLLNAIASLLNKQSDIELLPEAIWCNSTGWSRNETVDIASIEGGRLNVTHRRLNTRQRLLHSSGPKWWTSEGSKHFRKSGDVLKCFEHFANVTPIPVGTARSTESSCSSQQVFSAIHASGGWSGGETTSGPGSTVEATALIRRIISILCRELQVRSVLDIPCGDHNWMAQVDLGDLQYIGADVVPALIDQCRDRYPDRRFEKMDVCTDRLPAVDLILTRDCLVHLPYEQIHQALTNFTSTDARWLLATHFPGRTNHDIRMGNWRPLDLCAEPFRLPAPKLIINEDCKDGGGGFSDKSLGLWELRELRQGWKR